MKNILLSEKQSHLLQLLEWEFSDADFTCFCIDHIDQAKEVMLGERVDAVVLGLGQPIEEDVFLLCWVKKFYPKIPIILFAGEEQLQSKSIVHFADAWVEKSSHINLLVEKVRQLIKDRSKATMMF